MKRNRADEPNDAAVAVVPTKKRRDQSGNALVPTQPVKPEKKLVGDVAMVQKRSKPDPLLTPLNPNSKYPLRRALKPKQEVSFRKSTEGQIREFKSIAEENAWKNKKLGFSVREARKRTKVLALRRMKEKLMVMEMGRTTVRAKLRDRHKSEVQKAIERGERPYIAPMPKKTTFIIRKKYSPHRWHGERVVAPDEATERKARKMWDWHTYLRRFGPWPHYESLVLYFAPFHGMPEKFVQRNWKHGLQLRYEIAMARSHLETELLRDEYADLRQQLLDADTFDQIKTNPWFQEVVVRMCMDTIDAVSEITVGFLAMIIRGDPASKRNHRQWDVLRFYWQFRNGRQITTKKKTLLRYKAEDAHRKRLAHTKQLLLEDKKEKKATRVRERQARVAAAAVAAAAAAGAQKDE
eukprot:NODE_1653_length_1457_cov_19.535511_g1494_i0.p2 GENE.NODE_1653_length_1457_cov_19.535511_g1494_i0~~NODE_1653_length_1457_cov_19.535511_g1494_i0.p2  ORF type:complete len:408 (+),score=84.76 NODE_1653_length_1457_cov_19.535511_g1494_i0:147-1370(+)